MDLQLIKAISTTSTQSGLCIFSNQIEWKFRINSTKKILDFEFRHYGMLPLKQVLLNNRVLKTSFLSTCLNAPFKVEGLILKIKHYGKSYKLLVNEQDFDVFAHRLSTIPEMDDEQKDNSVLAGFSRHWTQLKRLSTKGRMSGFLSTEQTSEISSLSFTSIDNALNSDEKKEIEDLCIELKSIKGKQKVLESEEELKNTLKKINSLMENCKNLDCLKKLQDMKLKFNERFERNLMQEIMISKRKNKEFLKKTF